MQSGESFKLYFSDLNFLFTIVIDTKNLKSDFKKTISEKNALDSGKKSRKISQLKLKIQLRTF